MLKTLLTGLTLPILLAPAALAADANHPEASFRTMINMGFHVVATQAIPPDEAKTDGMISATPSTIVTLQNGTSVAVCTFSTKNWIFMADSDLEASSGCDYRDYSSPTQPAAAAAPASPAPAASSSDDGSAAPASSGSAAPAPSGDTDSGHGGGAD